MNSSHQLAASGGCQILFAKIQTLAKIIFTTMYHKLSFGPDLIIILASIGAITTKIMIAVVNRIRV